MYGKHRTAFLKVSVSQNIYSPQTKLREGNVFTPVCQSFCSQGGSLYDVTPVWLAGPMFLPGGSLVSGPMFLLGVCFWSHVPCGVSVWGVGGSVQGVSVRETPLDRNPPERDPISCLVKSGRYTSYSNAFLFEILGVLEILNHLRRILLFRHYSSLEQEFYTNSLEKIPFGPCKERTIHFTDLTNSNTCVLDCTTVTVFGLLLQGFEQAPKLSTM